ncbi:hypothetical protein EJ08DRAFT_529160 [Tothia fuscella]|uniref:Uncharacterized protein n=1 Tax=Tothia fuscella TaxID=1048955 RepID=A0A9P4TTX6_9PEZI|nr:hypothetical protein EJ08DRAFT_529160 [Tothia fuscella]
MSTSSQALASAARGVSWQIDIPTLTQVIVGLGAAGLKQLAACGIDIHSLGSLLAIAELTQTSDKYRLVLEACKERHTTSKWVYKAFEFAGASNFFVGTLFKDARGVNILALLSTIVPFFDQHEFEAIVIGLCNERHIPIDSQPGLGELSKIREALLPFTQTPEFPSLVSQYHLIFLNAAIPRADWGKFPASHAIPDKFTIIRIINLLYQITTSTEPYVLRVRGIRGAAWVAVYAVKVLDLRCCANYSSEKLLPINVEFEEAQVVLYIDDCLSDVSLYRELKLDDHIVCDDTENAAAEWAVDCDVINFLEHHCPQLSQSRLLSSISHFVAANTIQIISRLLAAPPIDRFPSSGSRRYPEFITYLEDATPLIQQRAIEVLTVLGFKPNDAESYRTQLLPTLESDGFVGDLLSDTDSSEAAHLAQDLDNKLKTLFAPLFWGTDQSQYTLEIDTVVVAKRGRLDWSRRSAEVIEDRIFDGFRQALQELCNRRGVHDLLSDVHTDSLYLALQTAIRVSSVLAFTDWPDSHRKISSTFLEIRPRKCLRTFRHGLTTHISALASSRYMADLLNDALLISTRLSASKLKKTLAWNYEEGQDWIGQDFGGVVGIDTLACPPLAPYQRGCLLSLFVGHLAIDGRWCTKFREEFESTRIIDFMEVNAQDFWIQASETLTPSNGCENLKLRGLSTVVNRDLWLSWTFRLGDKRMPALPRRIATACYNGAYTRPCGHDPATSLDKIAAAALFQPMKFEWTEGLMLYHAVQDSYEFFDTHRVRFVYEQVHNNFLGRWATCESQLGWDCDYHTEHKRKFIHMFQRRTCLDCITKAVKSAIDSHDFEFEFFGVVITPDLID